MSRLNLIDMFKDESAETFNKCSKAYELGRADERAKVATEILKDIESFCKDNTRQSFNWSEVWLGLWKILKDKYGAEH